MPGLNTTGAPNNRDYTLGRGIVRMANLNASGLPDTDGFRDLGNAPEFNVTLSVEDVRHQSSRTQLKFTDKRCTISQEIGLSFILDHIEFANLSDFFAGATSTYNNPHDTTFVATAAIITTALKPGNWYQLKDDDGARVYDLGAAGLVYAFSEDPAGTPVTLVEGTDFELDKPMGLVRFLPTSTAATAGDTIGWAISTGASTPQDLSEVAALQRADVAGAIQFIQENACDEGNKTEYLFHKVSLSPDGDLPLIGDEFMQMSFTGVAEVNSAVSDTSKVLTIRSYDQQA